VRHSVRLSTYRYNDDIRGLDLAVRMLMHDARTYTICLFTRLSAHRVRTLAATHVADIAGAKRHRGPAPSQVANFLTNASLRGEVDALAGVCCLRGLIPSEPIANARTNFPTVPRGEVLCESFELFRGLIPQAQLSLDQLATLAVALAGAEQWRIERCSSCYATRVIDRLAVARRGVCEDCQREAREAGKLLELTAREPPFGDGAEVSSVSGQLDLFAQAPHGSGRKKTQRRRIQRSQK
jgi:hypothetical protein